MTARRWGSVNGLSISHGDDGHSIDFEVDNDLTYKTREARNGGEDAGGTLLIRFDIDDEGFSQVRVDPPGGWWDADSGRAPADLVRRGAEYLTALTGKLQQIDELAR